MSPRSVTPANESTSINWPILDVRISPSLKVGNKDAKHRIKRSSCSDISNLYYAMKQCRGLGAKTRSSNDQSWLTWPFLQFCKEILNWPITRSHLVIEDNPVSVELFEQVLQALILNTTREC